MNQVDSTRRLRRQRNGAALLAMVMLFAGFGVTLPRVVARYRTLRSAELEIVRLQEEIGKLQRQIVATQREITEYEREILATQRRRS